MLTGLSQPLTQEQFGALVGISQPRVADLIEQGVLARGAPAGEWILAYCARLREQAAGRDRELTVERAALARSQRLGQDIKNAVAQGKYAEIGLLADVLSTAAAAVVDQLDQLPGLLRKTWPDMPPEARDAIERTTVRARNEWAKGTADLVLAALDDLAAVDDEDEAPAIAGLEDAAP